MYRSIDIGNYLNHKVVGEIEEYQDRKDILWGAPHIMFQPASIPSPCMCGQVPFVLQTGNADRDNVLCEGQTIKISGLKKGSLYFLCFSEWTDVFEKLQIVYANDYIQIGELNAYNVITPYLWDYDIKIQTITPGFSFICSDGEIGMVYLNQIKTDAESPLREIRLPFNPLLHIFAITWEEKT